MKNINYFLLLLFFVFGQSLASQKMISPLRLRPALNANFGELRNNHFHAGLDYKTNRQSNKPIYAVADGWISRINVSPTGYGLALYIDHPNGYTSVYAHMNKFTKKVRKYIKEQQYKQESYKVTLYPKKNQFPIKQGEVIGLSGNTGHSGGPHLHFELRDTQSENPIDPFQFLAGTFYDKIPPYSKAVSFYPQRNKGVVNQSSLPVYIPFSTSKKRLTKTVKAWGLIGLGIKAYDRMNNASNSYGVKEIALYVDGFLTYKSRLNRFSYDSTRAVNSFIDFKKWRKNRSFYMKSFVEKGNHLQMYQATNANRGLIMINKEKIYKVKYILKDHFGNRSIYRFTILGKRQPIRKQKCENQMKWNTPNRYSDRDFSITLPLGSLYTDICFKHYRRLDKVLGWCHKVNTEPVSLHKKATIWIKTQGKRKGMGIVQFVNAKKRSWVGGKYKNGGIEAQISELGHSYFIGSDNQKPIIESFKQKRWKKRGRIQLRLQDKFSGIKSFRGTIDGKFALFSHDTKSTIYTYYFDKERLQRGKHQLVFQAVDNAGNKAIFQTEFIY